MIFYSFKGENDVGALSFGNGRDASFNKNSQYICISGVAHVFNLKSLTRLIYILKNFYHKTIKFDLIIKIYKIFL